MARTLLDQQQAYTYRTHTRHHDSAYNNNITTTNSTDSTAKRIKHIHTSTNSDSNIAVDQPTSSESSPDSANKN